MLFVETRAPDAKHCTAGVRVFVPIALANDNLARRAPLDEDRAFLEPSRAMNDLAGLFHRPGCTLRFWESDEGCLDVGSLGCIIGCGCPVSPMPKYMLGALPKDDVLAVLYDVGGQRLLATALHSRAVFQSRDGGQSWQSTPEAGVSIRAAFNYKGRLLVASVYNGLLLEQASDVASRF